MHKFFFLDIQSYLLRFGNLGVVVFFLGGGGKGAK